MHSKMIKTIKDRKVFKKRNKEQQKEIKTVKIMVHINLNIPIITMNVIGLNTPSKDRCCKNG